MFIIRDNWISDIHTNDITTWQRKFTKTEGAQNRAAIGHSKRADQAHVSTGQGYHIRPSYFQSPITKMSWVALAFLSAEM